MTRCHAQNIRRSTLRKLRIWLYAGVVLLTLLSVGLLILNRDSAQSDPHSPPWRYGAADARFTLVFYADLECPYCKDYSPQLRRWIAANPDVNLQWHHLPLSMHEPAASRLARWVECAGQTSGNTAFWSAVQWVYAHTRSDGRGVPDLEGFPDISAALKVCATNEQVANIVRAQAEDALASGITATPTLRLLDNASGQNIVLPGQVPGDVLLSAMDMLAAQDQK